MFFNNVASQQKKININSVLRIKCFANVFIVADAASSSPPQNETLNQSLLSDVSSASPLEEDVFLSDSNK